MRAPTIIKNTPGFAVERYRRTHNGFLPTEELTWIDSFITALKANLTDRCRDAEFEELKKLAIAGSYAIGQNSVAIEQDYKALYHELIMAVARKWPGETRHQTALKYINCAEQPSQDARAGIRHR